MILATTGGKYVAYVIALRTFLSRWKVKAALAIDNFARTDGFWVRLWLFSNGYQVSWSNSARCTR